MAHGVGVFTVLAAAIKNHVSPELSTSVSVHHFQFYNLIIPWINSPLRARICQPSDGFTYVSAHRDERSSSQLWSDVVSKSGLPDILSFLHGNNRYKSIATQTPNGVRLIPTPYIGRKSSSTGNLTNVASLSMSSEQYSLNRVTTGPGQILSFTPEKDCKHIRKTYS